jgi:hypothetical protein
MAKMKLEIDQLAVESFETATVDEERGTVHGNAGTDPAETCVIMTKPLQNTCNGVETCYLSCVCGTAYPDYCPERTFELVPSCIWTCDNSGC